MRAKHQQFSKTYQSVIEYQRIWYPKLPTDAAAETVEGLNALGCTALHAHAHESPSRVGNVTAVSQSTR